MNDWAGAPLGHAPGSSDARWHGKPPPSDDRYLTEPVYVPKVQRSTRAVMGLALVAAALYGSFVLAPWRHGDWLPYAAFVIAEVIQLANAAALWWTGRFGDAELWEPPEVHAFRRALLSGRSVPSVDVLVTVFGGAVGVG